MFALSPLPRTIEAALRDLGAKRSEIRRSALVDLVRHVDTDARPQIVAVLAGVLTHDPDPLARELAAIASADNAIVELVPELLRALDDAEPRVRQIALLALGELSEASTAAAIDAIRPMLASPLPALRYQALVAWRRIVGATGVTELVAALDDQDLEVRWVAWSLLEGLFKECLPPSLDPMLDTLRPHVDEPSLRVRVMAAAVLLRLGEPSAMTSLLEHVQNSSGIKRRDLADIAKRFGEFKFEPARNWLTRHARRGWFEGPLGWPATVALAALGDTSAQAAILDELACSSVRRRGRALEAVTDLGLVAARARVGSLAQQATGAEAWLAQETLKALAEHRD